MRLLADDDEAKAKERGELLEKLARANAPDEKTKRKDPKKVDLHYIEDQLKEDPGELPRKAAQRLQQAKHSLSNVRNAQIAASARRARASRAPRSARQDQGRAVGEAQVGLRRLCDSPPRQKGQDQRVTVN